MREHIDKAVRHMALALDDILAGAERIKGLKRRYPADPKTRPPLDVIGCKEHRDLINSL